MPVFARWKSKVSRRHPSQNGWDIVFGVGTGIPDGVRAQKRHGRWLPSRITSVKRAPAPKLLAGPTSARFHLALPRSDLEAAEPLVLPARERLGCPAVAVGHQASVGVDG